MIAYNIKTKEKKHKFGDGISIGDWFTENGLWRIGVFPDCAEIKEK